MARLSRWAAVVLELPRRRRETRNSSPVRDTAWQRWVWLNLRHGFRTCVFECFLHTYQILKPSANHANCHRTRNNRKSHDKQHDTMRNTIWLDQNLYMFKSICFQRVHWLSIVSRTCRRSQRATSIALWLPRRRQETTANGTFAWIPAAFSCNLETCQPLIELASLLQVERVFSASQMPFLQGADGPALHIKGGTWNQSEDRGSIALSDVLVLSKDMISRSVGAVSSLTVAASLCIPNRILPSNWATF